MTATIPEKHLFLPNGDIHPIRPPARRRARATRAQRAEASDVRHLRELYDALRLEGMTPGQLALAEREALTAAATRIERSTSQNLRRLIQPWQARALTYYDMVGEVWFASQFYGRTLSKVRLFPALLDDNGDAEETDDPKLQELWNRVQDPAGGRAQLQESYGRLMFVTGEGYLIASPDPDWGEVWEFLSPDELRVQPDGIFVRYRAPQVGTQEYYTLPDGEFFPLEGTSGQPDQILPYRLWRKHPRYSWWADSPMHAVLDILEELLLLTLAVRSQAKSRAANNGVLLWPDETSFPQLDASGDEDILNDPFFEEFAQSWVAPLADPGSASAGVPLFVRMASELIAEANGGPRYLKFDANDAYGEQGMRNELVRRFAMGVDLPPEQILGMTDANHWSAWIIDEQTWKAHLLPVTQRMCDDFCSSYLRPAARDEGYADWKRVVIGYDATEVINHPDRGKDALDLYNARAIGKSALRTAKGFDDEDAPDDDELNEMIGVQVRDGSLALYGIPQIRGTGVEPEPGEVEGTSGNETSAPAGPATGAEVEPGPPPTGPPEPRQPVTGLASSAFNPDRIMGAAEVALDRCRELAGQRLVRKARNAKCEPCLDRINGSGAGLVASALGLQAIADLGGDQAALVDGGADGFVTAAARSGVLLDDARALGDLIELHAARTLTESSPAPLPDEFHALIQQFHDRDD